MLKKALLLVLLITGLHSFAQNNWESLNPKPSYLTIKKVKFTNPQTGFAINGTHLLQTTDAGVTWNIKEPMPNANDIKFIGTTGYIASSNGNIYKSENSGENWSLIQTIPNQNFHTLCIVDETTVAIATENAVYTTTNGGLTFTSFTVQYPFYDNITSMYFTSSQTGFVATAYGSIYKTTDGGSTWTLKISSNIFPSGYKCIYFVNENLGFASQEFSNLMRTTDGGETWTDVRNDQMSELIYDIHFTDSSTGYACGEFNVVYKTVNGGASWTRIITPEALYGGSNLYSIYATGSTVHTAGASGAIYKSVNEGTTFSRYSPIYREIKNITFADDNTAYALVINGDIYKSTDAGHTWQFKYSFPSPYYSSIGLEFVNANVGFTALAGGIYKTTNGGSSWTYTTILDEPLACVKFIDENIGFVSGGYNRRFTKKTTDGGLTWQTVNNISFRKMKFLNPNVGYAMTTNPGKIYKTTDSGNNWVDIYTANEEIYDFDFADENTGYIAGNPGIQRKTTDGGLTWQEIPNLQYMYTSIVRFADVNTGYAISDYGYIYKTTDGGDSWVNEGILRVRDAAYKNGYIYLAGIGGMILRKPTGVLTTAQPEKTTNNLSVYPNPATTSFTIHAGTQLITAVELYDITGRKLKARNIIINNNEATIQLPAANPDMYIATVTLGDGSTISKKVLIK